MAAGNLTSAVTSVLATGDFNPSVLERELAVALEEDTKHKQTEAMKKRAITKAKDYDEFKNMVACAHLKPVSSREMGQLGDEGSRRGWKNKNKTLAISQGNIFGIQSRRGEKSTSLGTGPPTASPKTLAEFEKNWRRNCPSPSLKKRLVLFLLLLVVVVFSCYEA